jgi:hypothetical protein
MIFQIKVRGMLEESWSEWLGEVGMSWEPGEKGGPETILVVGVKDSSELFGILDRIRDLNLPLVSVKELGQDER